MQLTALLVAAGALAGASAQNAPFQNLPSGYTNATKPAPGSTFDFNIVYQPPYGVNASGAHYSYNIIYPRIVELDCGVILATAGLNSTPGVFPVFQSTDGGASWTWLSNITDQVNGLGMDAQPALGPVLPHAMGDWPKGTILASGNSWGKNSSNIDLYGSKDKGASWHFISNVARGAGLNFGSNSSTPLAGPVNGNHIFEPTIWYYNGTVGVFYSDERDPLHSQKLAHQESTDLKTWGPVINDVAYPRWSDRPGMTTIAYIPPLDQYILTHEYPGGQSWQGEAYPVYYRLSSSPFAFNNVSGTPISVKGRQPGSSPTVVWTPAGGPNGTLVVSDATYSDVFMNTHVGEPDRWTAHSTGQPDGYSRALHVMGTNNDHVMIMGAGHWPGADVPGAIRPLSVSVFSVKETLLKAPGDAGPVEGDQY